MSASPLYEPSAITSGAIQCGVPMAVERFDSVFDSCTETPKSASFRLPSAVSSRLAALTSRCSMWHSWWRCCSAQSVPAITAAT